MQIYMGISKVVNLQHISSAAGRTQAPQLKREALLVRHDGDMYGTVSGHGVGMYNIEKGGRRSRRLGFE